jgi:hypothetical protein|tara:strand:- start:150 stop:509 length:360 start_codon:yes stop_codon:yes gene_type:complete
MNEKEVSQEVSTIEKDVARVLQNRGDDYTYSRELLYSSAERLQDILDAAVQLAQESEHPRAIEVATGTATALSDIAQKMMEHQLRTEKLNNPKNEKVTTNNNLNVKLNTKDLLELLGKE